MKSYLANDMKELAALRKNLVDAKVNRVQLKAQLDAMPEALAVSESSWLIENIATEVEKKEKLVKKNALAGFDGVSKKLFYGHLVTGIEVKDFTTATIADEKAARDWAMTNYTPALKLDVKAIEKAGKDGLTPDGLVVLSTEYRAQIASDLSAYLSAE